MGLNSPVVGQVLGLGSYGGAKQQPWVGPPNKINYALVPRYLRLLIIYWLKRIGVIHKASVLAETTSFINL